MEKAEAAARSGWAGDAVLDFSLHSREWTRLPERGPSGSVQRGPANPARPGREQRYRERLGCRRSPEVPRTGKVFDRRLSWIGTRRHTLHLWPTKSSHENIARKHFGILSDKSM